MAKATNETDPAVLAAFDAMISSVPGVERKGAAMPYVSVNGHMVAMINKMNVIGLYLGKDDLARFTATFGDSPFEGTPGFINKDYAAMPAVLLADPAALGEWFRTSYSAVSKLKPKKTKR